MEATRRDDLLTVVELQTMPDGVQCALVDCTDYAAFAALPPAIEINGVLFGRTGWNSDYCRAYYKNPPLYTLANKS